MSDRITFGMTSRTVLSDIEGVYGQLTQTQNELSSGKKISKPSDDPYGTSQALLDNGAIAANKQYQTNVTAASTWLSTTDTALSSISSDLQRARDLVVQASTGTMSQTDRAAIGAEIGQLIDSIKTAGNAQDAGVYVFSGTATKTAPFTVGGTDAYSGSPDAINREIGAGIPPVQVNVRGDLVIEPIVQALRTAQNDVTGAPGYSPDNLGNDLKQIDSNADTLAESRASVGALQNRLSSAGTRLQQLQTALSQQLSNAQDTDMAQAMIDYSNQAAVYQAALKVGATLVRPTLLDYLS